MNSAHAGAVPIIQDAAQAFRPPRRVSVSEGAARSLVIRQPGGYSGPWSPEEAPYMVQPMDMLASRRHEALCFVGPARTGKTMGLIDGWVARNVTCDPGDMLIVQMSQEKAREYSKTRIDRAIRHSPQLRALMSTRGHDDNTHDKVFKHGMWIKIGWPAATQLSSSDYRYVALTDYDRFPDDIGGEGAGFPLALKRIQTYLSRGMCMVESSPGRECVDPQWRPATPHEAPPSTGVMGIYNRSDRRRWYWRCPDCSVYFEAKPGLELFTTLPPEEELKEVIRNDNLSQLSKLHSRVCCPDCGSLIDQKYKPELNNIQTARWLADGQTVTRNGEVLGPVPESTIVGYWLGGVAAAYQNWESLVLRYLQGLREYVLSGSELTLKVTTNTDQGTPYIPRALLADKENEIEQRQENLARYTVPDDVRFLVASIDVQGGHNGRFVIEVRGFGKNLESWLVDRYSLRTTERNGETSQVDPAGYPEDWDLLTAKVVTATYRTSGDQEMRIYRTAVDTGGEAGTTPNAYAWYRRLREEGLSARVLLVKGASRTTTNRDKPMVKGHARQNNGKAIRNLPLWLVDTNYYKDIIAASTRRKAPGPGFYHPPNWLPASYFDELRAEIRLSTGKWKQIRARNEAIDLWVYSLAVCESLGAGAKGALDWDNPPPWASPILDGGNSEMITPEERRAEKSTKPKKRAPKSIGRGGWGDRL
jgi:phage terminase large subunit GpA-like protein